MANAMNVQKYVSSAEEFKKNGCYWSALGQYRKAIELLKAIGDAEMDFMKKKQNYDDLSTYFDYIQRFDVHFDFNSFKDKGEKLEILNLPKQKLNVNYAEVFRKYCSSSVKEIIIYDNVMCFTDYMDCLRKLMHVFRDNCENLRLVLLKCRKDKCNDALVNQKHLLEDVAKILSPKGAIFRHEFTQNTFTSEHKVVFNTGIVFVFERGFNTFTFGDVAEISKATSNSKKSATDANVITIWKTDMLQV